MLDDANNLAPKLHLPPLMGRRGANAQPVTAVQAVVAWLNSTSNCIAIYGRPGSGKSWLANQVVERTADLPTKAVLLNYDLARIEIPDLSSLGSLLVIDNFDSINSITEDQVEPPDLSELAHLLRGGSRLVLATRRSPDDPSDELNRQIASGMRWAGLGLRNPDTLELSPWSLEELDQHATTKSSTVLRFLVNYLHEHQDMLSDEFRRPLMIRMLAMLHGHITSTRRPLNLAQLYDEYASWALSLDYDRRRSAFREHHKLKILMNLAYDIFSAQPGTRSAAYTVSANRLTERVMEVVTQDSTLRTKERRAGQYAWTQDFIATNHFLEVLDPGTLSSRGDEQYAFWHPSHFEYFVALEILARIEANSSLGVRPEALSEATFRSMVLYFVREYWGTSTEAAVSEIARRRLSWPDRLLLFYTLEMTEHFGALLQQTDIEYFRDLESALPSVGSQFIQKAIKYQLVIAGRYSPYEYVSHVRASEDEAETQVERRMHTSGDQDITASLLQRLDNPSLAAGMPVAIYRLGQMGSPTSLSRLTAIAEDSEQPQETRSLAVEAIERIGSRQNLEEIPPRKASER